MQVFPQERISERILEQIVDAPVPQIQEQVVEIAKITPQERIWEIIIEQIMDVPVPQILEEIAGPWTCPFPKLRRELVR